MFTAKIYAQVDINLSENSGSQKSVDLSGIDLIQNKSHILIFENQVFSLIALENILSYELKLKKYTSFFSSGTAIF